MKMIENMRDWFYWNWPLALIITILAILLALIGYSFWYEYAYPCVLGHYELLPHFVYGPDGNITGSYLSDDFVCDCRTVRDSVK